MLLIPSWAEQLLIPSWAGPGPGPTRPHVRGPRGRPSDGPGGRPPERPFREGLAHGGEVGPGPGSADKSINSCSAQEGINSKGNIIDT